MIRKPFVLFLRITFPDQEPRWFGWKAYWTEQSAVDAFKAMRSSYPYFMVGNTAIIEGCGMTSRIEL